MGSFDCLHAARARMHLGASLQLLWRPVLKAPAAWHWRWLLTFYSKETIINLSYVHFHPFADYAHTSLLLAAFVTCCIVQRVYNQKGIR